jgi:hypothetical protein
MPIAHNSTTASTLGRRLRERAAWLESIGHDSVLRSHLEGLHETLTVKATCCSRHAATDLRDDQRDREPVTERVAASRPRPPMDEAMIRRWLHSMKRRSANSAAVDKKVAYGLGQQPPLLHEIQLGAEAFSSAYGPLAKLRSKQVDGPRGTKPPGPPEAIATARCQQRPGGWGPKWA